MFKNTIRLLVSQATVMMLSLVTQVIMARWLMPEGRGLYAICVVYGSWMILMTNFGNEFGVRFLFSKKKINISDSFVFLIITASISIISALSILYLLNGILNTNFIVKVSDYQVLLTLIFTITTLISKQTNVLLTLSKEFQKAAFISFFEEALKLSLLYAMLQKFKSLEAALISVITANIVIILFYFFRFKLYQIDLKNINSVNLKFIYKYGLKTFFTNFSNLANSHLGTTILSIYLSNERIGLYTVAFGLISRFQFIPDTLNRVFVPLSDDGKQKEKQSLKIISSFLFYLFLLILIFLLIFGDYIILIFFGEDYIEAGLLLKILSIGWVFKMLAKPIEAYYNEVVGKPMIISVVNGFTSVLLAVFMLIMSKNYGLIGASIASSVIMTLTYIVLFSSFLLIERESIRGFFELKKMIYFMKLRLRKE